MTISKRGIEEGRPDYEPTPETRMIVKALAANGLTHKQIASYVRISPTTLRKHFKKELRDGFDTIYAGISGKLVQKALAGHPASMFFWLKTRGGWRETNRQEISGIDGTPIDVRDLTTKQILDLLAKTDPAATEAGSSGGTEPEEVEDEPDGLV